MDLDDLHGLVPAAQAEDLLEQLASDRVDAERAAYDAERGWAGDRETGEPAEPAPGTSTAGDCSDEPPPLRSGQVLGLVEHVLGARVIAVHRPASRPRTVRPPGDDVP